ncbi:MAG TPA: hypothetical protein VD907_00680 [Verrucomicrobiae bacterium]|nr:hypothetical protein [Verrucomicrobiae bacterium]
MAVTPNNSPLAHESSLYDSFNRKISAAQPRIESLIEEITGWRGVSNLAEWVVRLLQTNVGRSGMDEVRPPCWQDHAPQTVAEFAEMMVAVTHRSADDPVIQAEVERHGQMLRDRFGL